MKKDGSQFLHQLTNLLVRQEQELSSRGVCIAQTNKSNQNSVAEILGSSQYLDHLLKMEKKKEAYGNPNA